MKENVKTWHLWIVGKATPDWRALPCSYKISRSSVGLFSRDFLNLIHITPIHDGFLEFLHWSVECQCLCTPWHNNSLKVRLSMGDCLATNFSAQCHFLSALASHAKSRADPRFKLQPQQDASNYSWFKAWLICSLYLF
jgi:hypothetical protein